MPEINPYEPPQTEIKSVSTENARAPASGGSYARLIVPSLIGLQIAAAVLCFVFDFMQAMAHSGYQQLQETARIFGLSFLCLGLLLLLIAIIRGSITLLIVEFLTLGIFIWLTLPLIH